MNRILKILIYLLVLDFLWIGVIFRHHFSPMISRVQGSSMQPRAIPAVIAYLLLFVSGAVFLPKLSNIYEAFLLGFCIYGVYDSTNYATIKNWDPVLAVVDTLWGGILFASIYWLAIME
jgi:uncharacterized membrane protein